MTTKIKEFKGFPFRVSLSPDDCARAPWEDSDCHGPVKAERRGYKKAPGEIILHLERNTVWIYDWQEACRIARTEWGCKTRQAAAQAVQRDVDYLKGYLNEDWCYCCMDVELLVDGQPLSNAHASLCGLESNMSQTEFDSIAGELCEESLASAQRVYSKLGEILRPTRGNPNSPSINERESITVNTTIEFDRAAHNETFAQAKDKHRFVDTFWYLCTWGRMDDNPEPYTVRLAFDVAHMEIGASYVRDGRQFFYIHAIEDAHGAWSTHS